MRSSLGAPASLYSTAKVPLPRTEITLPGLQVPVSLGKRARRDDGRERDAGFGAERREPIRHQLGVVQNALVLGVPSTVGAPTSLLEQRTLTAAMERKKR